MNAYKTSVAYIFFKQNGTYIWRLEKNVSPVYLTSLFMVSCSNWCLSAVPINTDYLTYSQLKEQGQRIIVGTVYTRGSQTFSVPGPLYKSCDIRGPLMRPDLPIQIIVCIAIGIESVAVLAQKFQAPSASSSLSPFSPFSETEKIRTSYRPTFEIYHQWGCQLCNWLNPQTCRGRRRVHGREAASPLPISQGVCGSTVSSPVGSGAEPQKICILEHFETSEITSERSASF